jgi:preprotein translocase subunit SecA
LEAYAQADPLVKYKGKASEMFQDLLSDIRAAVIGRIFLYQPRLAVAQTDTGAGAGRHPSTAGTDEHAASAREVEGTKRSGITNSASPANQSQSPGKKRKRHRH